MKLWPIFISIILFPLIYTQASENNSGYFFLSAGSYSVSPNMGTNSSLGFGAQITRIRNFAVGFSFLNVQFQPAAGTNGTSKMVGLFTKYHLTDSLSASLDFGSASQVRYTTTTSTAAGYGYYGLTLSYDFRPHQNSLGYALEIQGLSVTNNPAQSWMGGKFLIKYWF